MGCLTEEPQCLNCMNERGWSILWGNEIYWVFALINESNAPCVKWVFAQLGWVNHLLGFTFAHLTILKTSWHHWWTLSLKAAGVDMWRWGSLFPPVCIDNINAYPSAFYTHYFFCSVLNNFAQIMFSKCYGFSSIYEYWLVWYIVCSNFCNVCDF